MLEVPVLAAAVCLVQYADVVAAHGPGGGIDGKGINAFLALELGACKYYFTK